MDITKQLDANLLKAQKESAILNFKHEARRTAVQLAERTSKDAAGDKNDVAGIIKDADLIYAWLTQDLK
jgi:hypothetical protein